ncbi:hypothetical protein [Bradyrhizobium sp. WSM3983]|uniref:hypothetical protein n=1 Tax=Bradyrhizobium sp. WSM3983 TaxID=1038867 RepID=UPI0012EB47C7|nr:hypothetical protein [Bradyrhizobium sp. WSM3983]
MLSGLWISGRATKALSYLLLALVAYVIIVTRVGDWNIRLAMVSGDDSLEAISIYFARESEFSADVFMQAWAPISLASAVSWIPALTYKFLHVHPILFFKIFTVWQTVGLALAMFHFSSAVTRSHLLAWLTAAMTICWNPQFWNLSLIGGLEWMPYANWIALPFLVFAFSSAYRGERFRSYVSLLIGAMIHPIMGMLATAIVVPFVAYDSVATRNFRLFVEPAIASVVIAASAAVPMILSTRGVSFVSADQTASLLANQHVRPWGAEYPYGISSLLSSALCIASLVTLANTRDRFFIVALIMSSAMTAVHFLAVLFLIPPVMSVIASRSIILLVLVSLPFVASSFWKAIQTGNPVKILAVSLALFRTNAITLIAATTAVRGGKVGAIVGAVISVAVVISEVYPFLVPAFGAAAPWLLAFQNLISFSWGAIGVGLAGAILASLSVPRIGGAMIVAAMLSSATLGAYRTKLYVSNGKYADYAAAQLWARDNTAPGAAFTLLQTVPELSWRSLSERPVVSATGVFTVYRLTTAANDYNKRLADFQRKRTTAASLGNLQELDENYWRAFAEEFGVDYLVRPIGWPALAFPEAYQNLSFRIYQIRR